MECSDGANPASGRHVSARPHHLRPGCQGREGGHGGVLFHRIQPVRCDGRIASALASLYCHKWKGHAGKFGMKSLIFTQQETVITKPRF